MAWRVALACACADALQRGIHTQTGVVRTLPRAVQVAYRVVLGAILLTPEEGARSSVFCAAAAAAASAPRPGPYFDSSCALAPYHPSADDQRLRAQLWDYTMRTLGLDEATLALR